MTGANRYWLTVATSSGTLPTDPFASSCTNCVITCSVSSTSHTAGGTCATGRSQALSAGTTYYWRVQAWNTNGTQGNYSSIRSFTTASSLLPAPSLSSPSSGATGVSTTPAFSWSSVTGANRYWLTVATSSGTLPTDPYTTTCSGCVITCSVSATSHTAGGTCTTGRSEALSPGTTYYWKVQAWNTNGTQGNYSSTRSFTTASSLLPAPSLSSPSSGATGVSTTPAFSWSSVSGANRYWLTVATSSGTLPTDPYTQTCTSCVITCSVSTTSHTAGGTCATGRSQALNAGTTYYWRVQGWNTNGTQGNYSSIRSFTTQGNTPDIRVSPLSLTFDSSSAGKRLEAMDQVSEPGTAPAMDWRVVSALEAQAREKGVVRVIVGVKAPFTPEGWLKSARELEKQRTSIRAAQDAVLARLQGTRAQVLATYRFIPYMALEVDGAALSSLVTLPDVVSVEEDLLMAPTLASSAPVVGAPAAWALGYDGSGQVVAILDTGVDKTHPFFTTGHNKVVSEACYSSGSASVCPGGGTSSTAPGSGVHCSSSITGCNHGTHVAGIAAGNNGTGPNIGVARGADIISIQVFSRYDDTSTCSGFGYQAPCALVLYSDVLSGLERVYALRSSFNIAAANLSLGGNRSSTACDTSNPLPAIKGAIDTLASAKIATVAATGNDESRNSINFPSCISSAISVGGTDDSDNIYQNSNIASFVDLLAPGVSITSSVPGGGTSAFNGTSMAAPHVAGAWAVLKQKSPAATVSEVLASLRDTGTVVNDNRSGGTVTGMRRIAVDRALGGSAPGGQSFTIYNDGNATLSITSMQLQTSGAWIQWSPQAPFDIAAGGSRQVTVSVNFSGAPAGSSTRRLQISSNDSDESPYPGGVDITVNRPSTPTCYSLSLTRTGSGANPTASPGSSTGCAAGQYTAGASVQVTASPASGWSVGSWSGTVNDGSTSLTNTVSMPAGGHTVSVSYVQQPPACYSLSLTHTGSGANPTASPGSSTGCAAGQYTAGASIQVTASPASGWSVGNWSGTVNDGSTSLMNTVSMPAGGHTVSVGYVEGSPSGGAGYYTVTPCRILDTRGSGGLESGVTYESDVTGYCGVPATAAAVAVNITAVAPTGQGHMTLWPAQVTMPDTSSVNFGPAQTRANNAILVLAPGFFGADGAIWAQAAVAGGGTVDLVIDVVGYFLD